jgi:hypothetical protein
LSESGFIGLEDFQDSQERHGSSWHGQNQDSQDSRIFRIVGKGMGYPGNPKIQRILIKIPTEHA